jgi:hypothetical protein
MNTTQTVTVRQTRTYARILTFGWGNDGSRFVRIARWTMEWQR